VGVLSASAEIQISLLKAFHVVASPIGDGKCASNIGEKFRFGASTIAGMYIILCGMKNRTLTKRLYQYRSFRTSQRGNSTLGCRGQRFGRVAIGISEVRHQRESATNISQESITRSFGKQ
jgi:hypothetical protein